jgi:hypothetical protein
MAPIASFVSMLRAVNVGGTGKLPMSDLKAMCESIGFQPRTTQHRRSLMAIGLEGGVMLACNPPGLVIPVADRSNR